MTRARPWGCLAVVLVVGTAVGCGKKSAPPAPVATGAAPSSAPATAASSVTPEASSDGAFEQQTKWIRAYTEAFNRHDADAIARTYAGEDSPKWSEYKSLFTDFPDAKIAVTRSWHIKDVAVVEFVQAGTAAAGAKKSYGYVGAMLLWFDPAGQVTEDSTYLDELSMDVQLGLAKGPAAKVEVRPVRALPAFSGTWEQHRARGTAEEAAHVAVRDRLYAKLTASAEKDFLDMMTDDIELVAYDEPKDAKGKKEVADIFKGWKGMFSDIKTEAQHSWACGDFVIFEGTFSGKHTGPWGPIQATQKEFQNHFVDVTHIAKDGKVDRMWSFSNNAELIEEFLPGSTR